MNEKRNEVNNINTNNKVSIIIIPSAELESPKYKLTRYRSDNDETASKSSYELIEKKTTPAYDFEEKDKVQPVEPTVKGIRPKKPIPIRKTNSIIKILQSIKNIFFGNTGSSKEVRGKQRISILITKVGSLIRIINQEINTLDQKIIIIKKIT